MNHYQTLIILLQSNDAMSATSIKLLTGMGNKELQDTALMLLQQAQAGLNEKATKKAYKLMLDVLKLSYK